MCRSFTNPTSVLGLETGVSCTELVMSHGGHPESLHAFEKLWLGETHIEPVPVTKKKRHCF